MVNDPGTPEAPTTPDPHDHQQLRPAGAQAPHPVPGAPDNWKRFFSFNTDAKVIGIQYIGLALFFLLVGGLLAMVMRGELITPPSDLVDPSVYNGLYTMHGTVMLFLFLFPVLNGFNNLLIPTMIGAPDMAFPKLNAAAFWLVPVFAVVLMASFFVPGGPASAGWWSYPPVSIQNPLGQFINGQFLWILAVALSGISSIMGAINFVTTIIRMRAPGMGLSHAGVRLDRLGGPNPSTGRTASAHRRRDHAAV